MSHNTQLSAGDGEGDVMVTVDLALATYPSGQFKVPAGCIYVSTNTTTAPTPVTDANGLPVRPATSTTWAVSAASLPLPSGAATAAKQPALGTAGTASADVISIQGIASMTPVQVGDNSASLTVDAPVGTPVFVRLSDGSAAIETLPVSLASVPSHAVTNAGTFAVQAAQSGTWNITNLSGTVSLPTGASTLAEQQSQTTLLGTIDADTGAILTAVQLIDDAIATDASASPSKGVMLTGHDGTNARRVSVDSSGNVQVDIVSSALPSGAATEAKQDTLIGHVDGVESSLGDAVTALQIIDDWDETNRAKVNLIVGVAGVSAGSGAVDTGTQRMILATDDPAVALLTTIDTDTGNIATSVGVIDDWDESDRAKVNLIVGQAGITAGAGNVAANTPRVTLAADDPGVALLTTIDGDTGTLAGTVTSSRVAVNPISGQAGVSAGAGAVDATTQRTTLASDDPAVVALQIIDDWDETNRCAVNPISGQAGLQGGSGTVSANTLRAVLATDVALPAGTNAIGKVGHDTTGLGHGVKTVTSAGTHEALAGSTSCKWVIVQAQTDNTGFIAVGADGVDATVATGTGVLLDAGEAVTIMTDNLADIFIDSTVSGEGVRYTYGT